MEQFLRRLEAVRKEGWFTIWCDGKVELRTFSSKEEATDWAKRYFKNCTDGAAGYSAEDYVAVVGPNGSLTQFFPEKGPSAEKVPICSDPACGVRADYKVMSEGSAHHSCCNHLSVIIEELRDLAINAGRGKDWCAAVSPMPGSVPSV